MTGLSIAAIATSRAPALHQLATLTAAAVAAAMIVAAVVAASAGSPSIPNVSH